MNLSHILFHRRFKYLLCSLTVILGLILYTAGVITLLYEIDFTEYTYPLEIENIKNLIDRIDRHHDGENGRNLIVNYSSIVSTINDYTDVKPLKQFENIDILIDLKQSCKQFWEHDNNNEFLQKNFNQQQQTSHGISINTVHNNKLLDHRYQTQQVSDPIKLLIVVKSAVNNYLRRQAIRKSWYINGIYAEFSIRTVFVVGGCHERNYVPRELGTAWSTDDCLRHIHLESSKTGDIIQGSFIDMYYNNTLKTFTTMRWINDRCRQADFILALDDDYFLETENLLNYIKNVTFNQNINNDNIQLLRHASNEYLWAGFVRFYVEPLRHLTSKWYLPYKDYPYNKFPPFVSGGATLLSRKTIAHFYYTSYFTKSFKFDDVYIGLIAYKLNIKATHNDKFMSPVEELLDNPLIIKNSSRIAVHDIDPDRLVSLWEKRKSASLNFADKQEWTSCLSMHYHC